MTFFNRNWDFFSFSSVNLTNFAMLLGEIWPNFQYHTIEKKPDQDFESNINIWIVKFVHVCHQVQRHWLKNQSDFIFTLYVQ
jgi:hypothetical protein